MINIVINNESFVLPSSWSELSIKKSLCLQKLLSRVENIENYLECNEFKAQKWLDFKILVEIVHLLDISTEQSFDKDVECLYRLDEKGCNCNKSHKFNLSEKVWDKCLRSFAQGLVLQTDYQLEQVRQFEFRGEKYLLPQIDSLRQLSVYEQISADKFCVLNDLYSCDALENSSLILAILVSENGTEFSNERLYQKSLLFEQLPVSLAFEAFAMICNLHTLLKEAFVSCYKIEQNNGAETNLSADTQNSWQDLLIYVAGGIPSEIAFLKKQNCVDFMHLFNYKITLNS